MKKFTSLFLVFSLCVISVGCGGANEGTGEPAPANTGNGEEQEAADDAGVATDDALMSEGANE